MTTSKREKPGRTPPSTKKPASSSGAAAHLNSPAAAESKDQPAVAGVIDRGRIHETMDAASEALAEGRYFDCERLATASLRAAWGAADYDAVARIVMPLQESRRQRRLMAAETRKLFIIRDAPPPPVEGPIEPGCYVFDPPNVAADGRRLSDEALARHIPVIAIAREPVTRAGLLPVVFVGPTTIRARVRPPQSTDIAWVLAVIEEAATQAIAGLDAGKPLDRQIDDLVDMVDTLPESELLHQRLADVAREAARAGLSASAKRRLRTAAARIRQSQPAPLGDDDGLFTDDD